MDIYELGKKYESLLRPVFGDNFRLDDSEADKDWVAIILDGGQEPFMGQAASGCTGKTNALFLTSAGTASFLPIPTARLYTRKVLTRKRCQGWLRR